MPTRVFVHWSKGFLLCGRIALGNVWYFLLRSALGHLAGSLLMGHYLDDTRTCTLDVMLVTIMLFEPSQISRDLYIYRRCLDYWYGRHPPNHRHIKNLGFLFFFLFSFFVEPLYLALIALPPDQLSLATFVYLIARDLLEYVATWVLGFLYDIIHLRFISRQPSLRFLKNSCFSSAIEESRYRQLTDSIIHHLQYLEQHKTQVISDPVKKDMEAGC